ncbi:MFS transporter [Sphingomonas sp. ERG5]|uniref:MFS transporter n=1 Tax=Sphingomonas sp. ERG5 TaxID=1381597 RepID=UPI00054BB0A3|nr:MFS transporter [Sphingomonas sp. ERG5]
MKINPPILALAIGAFGIGVTEFAPMGMLPIMAHDLGVTIPVAGLLVSAYALGVLLCAPLMTLTTTQVPRKTLLIALMGIFTLGNLLSALSGSYAMLMVARIITSMTHGAFFGVGSIVAASVVPANKRAGAVAAMFMGLTIANVAGVPAAAWVGEVAGWKTAFFGIAGLGVIAMIALWFAVPYAKVTESADMRAELRVLRRPQVLTALALTVIGSGAMFTVFTYIAPILREETHASVAFITAMLAVYGIGLTVGNWLGGRYADRSIDGTLLVVLSALTALLLLFAVTMHWPIPAALSIFAWGVATFALVPPLQMRVMAAASDAPNLASAMNIGAFNLGNALGAAIGGAVISVGLGYVAVSIAGALVAGLALILAIATRERPIAAEPVTCPA